MGGFELDDGPWLILERAQTAAIIEPQQRVFERYWHESLHRVGVRKVLFCAPVSPLATARLPRQRARAMAAEANPVCGAPSKSSIAAAASSSLPSR